MPQRIKKEDVINPEKLIEELKKRGLTHNRVSEELGYNRNYITGVLKAGRMGRGARKTLEVLYNIKPEDIAPEKEHAEEPQEPAEGLQGTFTEEFWGRLYKTMYAAVYEAVRKAWSE